MRSQWLVILLVVFNSAFSQILRTGPTHGKVVVCHLSSWATYRPNSGSFNIENVDAFLCTHLIYAFVGLDLQEDSLRVLDPYQDLDENYGKGGFKRVTRLKLQYPHLKVTLAVGGWDEGSINFSSLASSPDRRGRFVSNSIYFLRKYNFDGLELDWKFPGQRGGAPADKTNFLLLVKELKTAFRQHNLLLTAAFAASQDIIDTAYEVEALAFYLDFFHLLCYDYHGAWDEKTGANAPLRSTDLLSVENSINYMLKLRAPAQKLVMGIPFYGRTFILKNEVSQISRRNPRLGESTSKTGFKGPFTKENGFMGYNEICLVITNTSAGWKTYWDDVSKTPFAVNGNQVISYDDERSINDKIRFAIEKGLAGAMVYSIDTDDFHGDCYNETTKEKITNFPLMRALNKAIETTLDDIGNNNAKGQEAGGGAFQSRQFTWQILIAITFVTLLLK